MRYLCVHCDQRWEAEGEEAARRCPSCLRGTGVEPERPTARRSSQPKRPGGWRMAAALVAGAVLGLFAWRQLRSTEPEDRAPTPLSEADLRAHFAAEKIDPGPLAALLGVTPELERFARQAKGGAASPVEIAEAVQDAVQARRSAQAFVPWSLAEPLTNPPKTAADLLAVVLKDGGRAELYPLELAAFEVALLRSLGLPAMVAERIEAGRRAPLDASGYLGYFVVALPGGAKPVAFDPYEGSAVPVSDRVEILDDACAVGAALSLRGLYESGYLGDSRAALESSGGALRVAARLPSVRSAHGIIVLAAKMLEPGLQELTAARQLRPDAARLHNHASVALLTGDRAGAEQLLAKILTTSPEFAGAHATLGSVLMLRGQLDEARAELNRANELAPDSSLVQWALAEYALRTGDREEALVRGQRALELRPSFDGKLRLAVLLHHMGRYDEMRALAHELLAVAPAYRQAELRELIKSALGPTALDPAEPLELDADAADLEDLGGPKLELELDSQLLGEGENRARSGGGVNSSKLRLKGP